MSYSERAAKQVTRPAFKLLEGYRRMAHRWQVWQLERELEALERERGFVSEEGAVIMAGALRRELGELKGRLSAKVHRAAEPKHAAGYSSGERYLEAECRCHLQN